MKKLWLPLLLFVCSAATSAVAQSSATIREYIETYKDLAIEEMQRTGVPAAITLAQGIHETGAGQSMLVRKSNNHFGIKCKSEWKGESVSHDDDARGECFRKYDDPAGSYRDHSDFLKYRKHYAFLFELDPTDFEGWAYGLKKAGYATNPKYPQILIKLIRDYNLQEYTLIAMGKKHFEDKWVKGEDREVPAETVAASGYPSGVFKINETNVVLVPKGTPFLVVAQKHDVSLRRLFDFNDMEPVEVAERDMLIYLHRKRKTGAADFHKVAKGETLYDIAQKEGIRMESLLNLNMLSEGAQPEVGETIYLKSHAPYSPRLASARQSIAYNPTNAVSVSENYARTSSEKYILHTVQAKETAYGISKRYEVSVEELMEWNGMESTSLKIGQQLRIFKKPGNATN
jgi:LysM repeat protein